MNLMTFLSAIALAAIVVPLVYLLVLALASTRPRHRAPLPQAPRHRFAITIPAHDEESVISETVRRLRELDYPAERFEVHVVADHCSDRTASLARAAGATVHERNDGPRTGKGGALTWLFARVLADPSYDAVVIFDGDTKVSPDFLRIMDARLSAGASAIQGQHVIRNPRDGWFPALTWAMFLIDNRFNNQGRVNLGLSAKNMGDSICFRAGVLRSIGWGQGLTEDYQLRQKLLLHGVRIDYEPTAKGYGEAVSTWAKARAQRARWLRGTHDASKEFARTLLGEGLRTRNLPMLDGALQALSPSYSTLTVITGGLLLLQLAMARLGAPIATSALVLWALTGAVLFAYPLFGLVLERAPARAYAVILTGPAFIVWRSWIAYRSRFRSSKVVWIRTAHGKTGSGN